MMMTEDSAGQDHVPDMREQLSDSGRAIVRRTSAPSWRRLCWSRWNQADVWCMCEVGEAASEAALVNSSAAVCHLLTCPKTEENL